MIADRFKLGHDLLLARWLLDDQPEVPVRNNAAPQAGGAGGQETQAARPVNNAPETDKNTNKALAADIQSTSLTREQITALSLSIRVRGESRIYCKLYSYGFRVSYIDKAQKR